MVSQGLTVCIVGAGSSYTPELVEGLLRQRPEELPIRELRLTDIAEDRLAVMAGFAARAVRQAGREVAVTSDARLEPMAEGADFVITQIRVGGMKARHLDESIPLKYGIVGQETTGPGGMCKALRTIPPMLAIAEAVVARSPRAFILNYANPSGIITEAVSRHTGARIVGLCSGVPGMQQEIADRFSGSYPDLCVYSVGLNHFGHIHKITSAGREVTGEVLERLAEEYDQAIDGKGNGRRAATIRLLGAYPIGYADYFYHRGRMVEERQGSPRTRAQEIESIEAEVLAEAAREEVVEKPKALERRGGGGYSEVTFRVMKAIANDTSEPVVANVPSRGSVEGIEEEAVVEVLCRVDGEGAHPLPVGPIPLAFRGVMLALKAYETLTVEAAVRRSRRLATLALLNHPLMGDLEVIEPLLDEMLAAHGIELR